MIVGFCASFIMIGTLLMFCRYYMPMPLALTMSIEMIGGVLVFIGTIVFVARSSQTGAGLFLDIPTVGNTICIDSGIANKRLDPNAKFVKTKDIGLGILKGKKTAYKDTGGGFRISGHDVRRTHVKISADLPEHIGQYLHQIKNKWKVKNSEEMRAVYNQLRVLHELVPGMDIMTQLEMIPILKPALKDEKSLAEIKKMDIDELRNMTEYLFDGETVHMEDVENFIKLASPNELDTWITQEINKNTLEKRNYRDPGTQIDWNKWLPALGFFMIIAVLATVILISYIK